MKEYYPFCVQIEIVQGCNRACVFCGTRGIERKIHYAKIETITHTANLLRKAQFTGRILLAGHGEPTLHPDLIEIVKTISRTLPKAHITMFTNGFGMLRNPELIHAFFSNGGDAVMFDEYEGNRISNRVLSIPDIDRYKVERLGRGTPIFDRSVKQKRVIIAKPIDEDGATLNRTLCNHCGAGMPPLKKPMKKACSIIFRDFFVRWDGNIAICCNDFRGEYYVTNINECTTFEEAYYHPRLEAARRRLMARDRAFYPCSVCNENPLRVGLLPDKKGQTKMPLPSYEDKRLTEIRYEPLSVVVPREWEGGEK